MKYIKKITIVVAIMMVAALTLMVVFSPYGKKEGFDNKLVINKVLIDAPKEKVYNYLGNSDNARDWSVFVDHINTLNAKSRPDGAVGSVRRCFKTKNETGIVWDEEILINEANQRRRLSIFNMKGFGLSAENLFTEQIYTEKNGKCELSFTLFFDETKSNWWDKLKLYYAAYKVSTIFDDNLQNIKKYNEKQS